MSLRFMCVVAVCFGLSPDAIAGEASGGVLSGPGVGARPMPKLRPPGVASSPTEQ
jgi:hypothetical protein